MLAVIGDVHGSIKTLKKLYYTMLDKYLIHRIVFLGDIVDRGLYSKEVVEFLMDRQGECLMTFLRGNHEDMLINMIMESLDSKKDKHSVTDTEQKYDFKRTMSKIGG